LTRDPADPGLEPGRVDEKTIQEFGPAKPGRPGRSTRDPIDPDETRMFFYICINKTSPFYHLTVKLSNHLHYNVKIESQIHNSHKPNLFKVQAISIAEESPPTKNFKASHSW